MKTNCITLMPLRLLGLDLSTYLERLLGDGEVAGPVGGDGHVAAARRVDGRVVVVRGTAVADHVHFVLV